MEVYFADMALYPEEVDRMHRMVGQVYEQKIHQAGQAGADGIMIGEDMGTQTGLLFSPSMFRSYFAELYARLMAIAVPLSVWTNSVPRCPLVLERISSRRAW